MLSQLGLWIQNQRIVAFGLMVILLCFLGAGLVTYFLHPGSATTVRTMLIGLIGGSLLVIALLILHFRKEVKPFNDLMEVGRSINDDDLTRMAFAVTELAQGNLATKFTLTTRPLQRPASGELLEMGKILNDMVEHLENITLEFNALTDVPCKRLCYVGADSFLEGKQCAEAMGNLIGGKGEILITTGFLHAASLELRRKGFASTIRDKFPGIEIVEVFENFENPELTYERMMDMLARYPRLAGVYITEGSSPHAVARAVTEVGKARKIVIVGHDLTVDTVQCMKDRTIAALLGQDPFAQGHNPVIHLFNHIVAGWVPPVPRLLTQPGVINPDNYTQFWQPGSGLIQSPSEFARLAKPVQQMPAKPLKIAVLGQELSAFWIPVKSGVMNAAQKLRGFNTTVEWVVADRAVKEKDVSAVVFGEVFERLIREGFDGIATVLYDHAMIPLINRAVDQGIPVITLNSEPISLRSMVGTITEQAFKLMGMSEQLSAATVEASTATSHINAKMADISRGTGQQNEHIKGTEADLDSLLGNIDRINHEAGEGAVSAENAAKSVGAGTAALDQTLNSIQSIEQSVGETWKIVNELGKNSERIDVAVELIDDIASMVNVLALNASIEATRAGEAGKGFMVVANEIRRLSKRTTDATREVTELITTVQSGIGGVQKSIEQGLERVRQSGEMTDKAKELLAGLRSMVDSNKSRMQKIASGIGDMQRLSHQVGAAMENVASVSGRNASSIEEINVASKELSDQFTDVAGLAQNLENIAQSQKELLAKFSIQ
jgi:methyl-accepting chemotaxis protein